MRRNGPIGTEGSKLKNWHPLTKLTLVVGGGAVVVLALMGENDTLPGASAALPQLTTPRAESVSENVVKQPLAMQVPTRDDMTEMVERPLFKPNRRPPPVYEAVVIETVEPQAGPVEPVVQEPDVAFVGSLVRDGETMAIVSHGFDGHVMSLAVGAQVDGWTVLDIDKHVLVLGHDDQRLEYAIFQ